MVYANLGVAQIAQGKIDEGYANILKAQIEDEPYHKTDSSKSIFENPLYMQFEDKAEGTKDYLLKHSELYCREDGVTINKDFISGLIFNLDTDSHILFVSLIEKMKQNFESLLDKDNRFTRLQIFLCLQDLCLSVESAIKKKNTLTGTIKPLLDTLFSKTSGRTRGWKTEFDNKYEYTTSHSGIEFENNLKEILKTTDKKARRLLICCAVRNFSSHNLNVESDWIFQNYSIQTIFDNIIASCLFLYSERCL